MNEFGPEMISIILSSIISLISFAVSYRSIRYTYKNDIKKLKAEKVYDKIEDLPYEILEIMHNVVKYPNSKATVESLSKFMYKIIAYGSPEAVKIACFAQQTAYNQEDPYKLVASYSILVSQLKYDLSGQIIPPDSYFQIKMTDYKSVKIKITKYINSIVKDLNLKKEFYINSKQGKNIN